MYCDIPPTIIPTANSLQIYTDIYVNTDDPMADIVSFPNTITSNYEAIGTNPVVEFIGKDAAENLAACHSQLKIEGKKHVVTCRKIHEHILLNIFLFILHLVGFQVQFNGVVPSIIGGLLVRERCRPHTRCYCTIN